ncbi:DsbE family thiol:disulfide interchange protein [Hyphomicrobium sp.]|uniref:DsbE family thiol:disulfide interchange protein n=1 Tax=Hyphomicrobium sp. TaxID=82 RepID=UPI0025C31BE8|nr:DsbE family thiol:disulfide interchange protein [Hyphomicrobium sp.]MCC7253336.1 DsbE family thiol:disulfide interchange protein [Hyphomicrobium sp.]
MSETVGPSSSGAGRHRWAIAPLLIFAAIAALFAFALTSGDPSKLPSALIGRPVPQTVFPPLEGLTDKGQPVPGFAATDLARGRVSVVNFWASWCVPCIEEHPLLIALRERSGVEIYGVNYKDQPEAGRRFLGRYGNPFTAVGVDRAGRNAIEWGVYGMPETFVIDGQGRIAYKHVGPISKESLEKTLLPAIAAAQKTAQK